MYHLRVRTGFAQSAIELRADFIHPDLADSDNGDQIGIDATGCFIVHDTYFDHPI
jgi:hypothetical protein